MKICIKILFFVSLVSVIGCAELGPYANSSRVYNSKVEERVSDLDAGTEKNNTDREKQKLDSFYATYNQEQAKNDIFGSKNNKSINPYEVILVNLSDVNKHVIITYFRKIDKGEKSGKIWEGLMWEYDVRAGSFVEDFFKFKGFYLVGWINEGSDKVYPEKNIDDYRFEVTEEKKNFINRTKKFYNGVYRFP